MNEELPKGWEVASLGSLVSKLVDGSHNPPPRQTQGLKMLSAKNVADGAIDFADSRLIDAMAFEQEARRTKIEAGDVLLTIVGSIGRSAVVPSAHPPFTLQRSVAVIRTAGLLPEFLSYQFRASTCQSYFRDFARGTAQKGIYLGALSELPIVVAPFAEQVRVAAKIDELFSQIDGGERALERVRKLVERYRQSVLKAAVTGELTREWREKHAGKLEAGEALLTRVLGSYRQAWEQNEIKRFAASKAKMPSSWRDKYKDREIANAELGYEVPAGWTLAGLDQLVASLDRAIQSGPFGSNLLHSEFQAVGKLVIGIDNVREGWFSLGSQHRISNQKFLELKKYSARPKDFVITIMATIGRSCVLPADLETSIISKHVYRFTLDPEVMLPEFVNICVLGHPAVRNAIFGSTQGQTRPGLNKSILLAIPFPLPSLVEQQMIRDIVSRLLSEIGPLEAAIADHKREAQALRQAILRAAFSGRLVPQDSTDEPAFVLLERIAAERAVAHRRKATKLTSAKKTKSISKA